MDAYTVFVCIEVGPAKLLLEDGSRANTLGLLGINVRKLWLKVITSYDHHGVTGPVAVVMSKQKSCNISFQLKAVECAARKQL